MLPNSGTSFHKDLESVWLSHTLNEPEKKVNNFIISFFFLYPIPYEPEKLSPRFESPAESRSGSKRCRTLILKLGQECKHFLRLGHL